MSSPHAAAMPVAVVGRDGLVRKKATTDDEIEDFRLCEEVETMQIVGSIRIEALKKIAEQWGPIDQKELAVFLSQNDHVPPGWPRLSRAFSCSSPVTSRAQPYVLCHERNEWCEDASQDESAICFARHLGKLPDSIQGWA